MCWVEPSPIEGVIRVSEVLCTVVGDLGGAGA